MTSFYDVAFDDEELLPSTCWTRWTDINGTHAMRRGYEELREGLGTHAPIPCYLPPSLDQTVPRAARHLLNPFRTKGASLLESWVLLALVAVFRGRIVLKQTPIGKTSVTSGNAIEHKVVLGVPRVATDEVDYVTQLFKAMLSATHVHWNVPPDRQLRVYGLLTDSMHFEFYSYDPVTMRFSCDRELIVCIGSREDTLDTAIPVTNEIFSIHTPFGICRTNAQPRAETAHSEVDYDLALTLAEDARGLFTPEPTSQEEHEIRASQAFDMLHQSISIVPREMNIASDEQELASQ
ncbi:hypothetical protein PENSPDRAFT_451289 [Peniophora sp. CONT]|nr:hypothetical protein PENSPDRAFT_451289 [Peniophora sp. CONT]